MPHVGEFLPWIVLDALDLPLQTRIQETVVGWLEIYFSSLLLDDVLDRKLCDEELVNMNVVAYLMMQRGAARMLANSPNPSLLRKKLDEACSASAQAVIAEIQRARWNPREEGYDDLSFLWQKASYCLLVVESLCLFSATNVVPKRNSLVRTLQQLLSGLIILDDITDWQEDFESRRVTLVNQTSSDSNVSPLARFESMITSGELKAALKEASRRFGDAMPSEGASGLFNTDHLTSYLTALQTAVDKMLGVIDQTEIELDCCHSPSHRLRILTGTRRSLRIVLQTT